MFYLVLLFVLFFLNTYLYFYNPNLIQDVEFFIPLFSILISIIPILPKLSRNGLSINLIFILISGILFFNFPWYFYSISSFGISFNEILRLYSIDQEIFIKSAFLLSISIILISFSYILTSYNRKKFFSKRLEINNFKKVDIKPYLIIFYILLIITFGELGLTLGSSFKGDIIYSYTLLIKFIHIQVIILIFNILIEKKFFGLSLSFRNIDFKLVSISVILFIFFLLIGGDRGPVLSIILILFFGFLVYNNMTIKYFYFIPMLLFMAGIYFVFDVVETLRLFDGNFNLHQIEEANRMSSSNIKVLGFSSLGTILAIEGISHNLYSHTYGFLFLQSIYKGIPYFGNIINSLILSSTSELEVGSASLLTHQYLGSNPPFGIGTTYLADLYIEFGFFGVIVGSILLGVFVAYIDFRLLDNNLNKLYIVLFIFIFIGQSFYLGRSSIFGFVPHFISIFLIFKFTEFLKSIIKLK